MIALLDTQSFLWASMAPEKRSAKARDLIGDLGNAIHLSTVSLWEISLKFSLGNLQMTGVVPEELVEIAHRMDYRAIVVSTHTVRWGCRLPGRGAAAALVAGT